MTEPRFHCCPVAKRLVRLSGKYTLASGEAIRWGCAYCDFCEPDSRHPDYQQEATFRRLMADVNPDGHRD